MLSECVRREISHLQFLNQIPLLEDFLPPSFHYLPHLVVTILSELNRKHLNVQCKGEDRLTVNDVRVGLVVLNFVFFDLMFEGGHTEL